MSYLPSNDERVEAREFVDWLIHTVDKFFEQTNIEVEILAVGSVVKGTFVSGEHDVDLYVLTASPQQALELVSQSPLFQKEGYLKRAGPLLIWAFKFKKYDVDMVFGKPGEVKTDTLEHAQFFNEQLSQSQKNEVIKAKAFFKSRGFYSAEVGGITGVAIEELIRQHKNFCGLCNTLEYQDWPWLQDPVMKEKRNLLASVIPKRQRQIQAACFAYLHNPRKTSYRPFTIERFMASYSGYCFIIFKRKKEMSLDFTIVYSACDHLMREIKNFERDIHEGDFDVCLDDKHICVAVSLPHKLCRTKEIKISIEFTQGLQAFKTAHMNWYEQEEFLRARVPRKIVYPLKYFKEKLTKKLRDEIGYVQE